MVHAELNRVKILQDRVFFTFSYCEMLEKEKVERDKVGRLLEELEGMIMIKSQIGFLGFFWYLKYRVNGGK